MGYSKTVVILPGYGLDNLPYEMDDDSAAGLLNAFAVACHPSLLAATGQMPGWSSCDEHTDPDPGCLFIIPPVSEDHLYGNWTPGVDPAPGIVRGLSDRAELVAAALAEIGVRNEVDPDLTADCMAIGIAHALMEMLTQQMHYFSNIDAEILGQNTVAAGEAIVAGNKEVAREKLSAAYEVLVEARERFYPVDCYLVDLCLVNAEQANKHLSSVLAMQTPVNLLMEAAELDQLQAATLASLRDGLQSPTPEDYAQISLVGGEHSSLAAPLVPLADWLRDFESGMKLFDAKLGAAPRAWCRKRYGFSTLLPQVLTNFGFHTAMHFALDDGTYPDAEHSKLSWEGCDGTHIDAMTRIPIAIESASTFIRLPQRIAESMQDDMVAAVLFARLPETKSAWLSDFQRIQRYGDVFGRFVTIDEFAADSGDSGSHSRYESREYLTPFLIQGSALGEKRPVSRFALAHHQRVALDAAIACQTIGRMILDERSLDEAQARVEQIATIVDEQQPVTEESDREVVAFGETAVTRLARVCGSDAAQEDGVFVFNPLSFDRQCEVLLPDNVGTAIANVPALGFAWVDSPTQPDRPLKVPLATKTLLHNGLFEIHLSEETGGISTIKGFARSPNRLSQQLAFRFEKQVSAGTDEEGEAVYTSYSTMKCREITVLRSDGLVGEVETRGDLLDPSDNSRLASFKQRIRVVHRSPLLNVDIEITDIEHFPEGNPWLSYYGCRFAWNDAAAALTRSVFGQAHGFSGERFESPHFLEIASDDLRTTIISHGMPFFRKTDMRMADSLMIVEGEEQRRFRFTIALDQQYPQRAALDAMTPPLTFPCGKPSAGTSGWFVRLSAKNVLVVGYPQRPKPETSTQTFRLMETEGRSVEAKLACFKPVKAARKIDFLGNQTQSLAVDADGTVTIGFRKYELCDVQVDF